MRLTNRFWQPQDRPVSGYARAAALAATATATMVSALLIPLWGMAATFSFTVNNTADLRDDSPGDGICRTIVGGEEQGCTLRAAIDEANALAPAAGGLEIILPAGTFTLTRPGAGEGQNASGDLDIRCNIKLQGAGLAATVIDGAGLDRVFDITWHYPDFQVEMADLTITGGAVPMIGDDMDRSGGGIFSYGNLTLTRVKVTNNASANGRDAAGHFDPNCCCRLDVDADPGGAGGGIFNGATLHLIDSVVSNNSTGRGGSQDRCNYVVGTYSDIRGIGTAQSGGAGGGIYNGYDSTLAMNHSVVSNNHTGNGGNSYSWSSSASPTSGQPGNGGPGGGIYGFYPTVFQLNDSTVSGNWTGHGGGRYPDYSILEDRCLNDDCPAGNGGDGGGLECEADSDAGPLEITNSTIADNYTGLPGGYCSSVCSPGTAGQGGGMFAWGGPTVVINSSTISGNTASGGFNEEATVKGGGLYVNGVLLTIESSTISGNHAPFAGGLYFAGSGGSESHSTGIIRDSTFTLNQAHRGGGIVWVGLTSWNMQFTMGNTILAGNIATDAGNDCFSVQPENDTMKIASYGYNLIGSTANCGFAATLGDHIGNDPKLGPLRDNGGPTYTHLPGTDGFAFDNGGGCLANDQRGAARPQAVACDIGAVEGATYYGNMPGDINLDGSVDLKDCIVGLKVLAGQSSSETVSASADVNEDGKIGTAEVLHDINTVAE